MSICCIVLARACISFTVFSFLQPLSYLALGLCIVCFLGLLPLCFSKASMSLFGLSVAAFFVLLLGISILCGADVKNAFFHLAECGTIVLLFYYYKDDLTVVLKSSGACLSLMVYANLALMVIFPNWMFVADDSFDCFLLGGNYNQTGVRLLCAIATNMLCNHYGWKWRLNTFITTVVSFITLALIGSMTSLSSIIVFVAICLVPGLRIKKAIIIGFFTLYVFFQVFVCFSGEGLHNNELAVYIIQDLLHKDLTFTNRTYLWDASVTLFGQSPIWGYGQMDVEWMHKNISPIAIGPHNLILFILLEGGLLLITAFLASMLIAFKRIHGHREASAYMLLAGLTTLLFMQTMEVYFFFFTFYFFTLLFYYPEIAATWRHSEASTNNIAS